MSNVIVSDTSCLILFYKIGRLSLLKSTFGQILITSVVADEFNQQLPSWINIQNPTSDIHKGLSVTLDLGESTSIALASERENSLLLIDEIRGRKIAKSMGIAITGSLGVLLFAKKKGIIKRISPILRDIRNTNFRVSPSLLQKIKELAGES